MEAAVRGGVFVDASAWYALSHRDDRHHVDARRRFRRLVETRRGLITRNLVVAKTYTILRQRLGFRDAWTFLGSVRSTRLSRTVYVSADWEEDVERLLAQFDDQVFSYVDATSFVTM